MFGVSDYGGLALFARAAAMAPSAGCARQRADGLARLRALVCGQQNRKPPHTGDDGDAIAGREAHEHHDQQHERDHHVRRHIGERQLERTMLDFMEQQYDVLLCSTIIESGLDIPNVNTIIIYDADKMGLAQLYQLRGRVGRGARLGYAYLTFMRDKVLSDIAEKRLSAIREFTQFGAGFKIAMRDLEIRGAGNLLGPEQHGHMAAVGYDLYCIIGEGAVKEAKGEKEPVKIDTVVDIPVPASISTHYIPRESERLSMYKRIALIETRDDLYDVQDELIDRYGDIPEDTANLLNIALIKADCSRAGVTQLRIRDKEVRFVFDKQAPIDGAKLIAAAGNIAGARMTFGDTPSMVISRPKSDAAALYAMLPQFVYMHADCLSAN